MEWTKFWTRWISKRSFRLFPNTLPRRTPPHRHCPRPHSTSSCPTTWRGALVLSRTTLGLTHLLLREHREPLRLESQRPSPTWPETPSSAPTSIRKCSKPTRTRRAWQARQRRRAPQECKAIGRRAWGKPWTAEDSWWWSCSTRRVSSPPTRRPPRSRPSTSRSSPTRCACSWRSGRCGRRWWPPPTRAPPPPPTWPPGRSNSWWRRRRLCLGKVTGNMNRTWEFIQENFFGCDRVNWKPMVHGILKQKMNSLWQNLTNNKS